MTATLTRERTYPSGESRYDRRRFRPTGEFRPPRQGEWYLSGAVVEAYRAPNDLGTPYHIAKVARLA